MKRKIILLLLTAVAANITSGQVKKIGLLINIKGPKFITRNYDYFGAYMNYHVKENDSIKPDNKFVDIFSFYKGNINNPKNEIVKNSSDVLYEYKYTPVLIEEDIDNDTPFPAFKKAKTDLSFFRKNLYHLKEKYGFDSLIIINGAYGFELEKLTLINGDKKNNIHCKILLIDLKSNKTKSHGNIEVIKNIKNWNQPPNYPTVIESYNELITNDFIPKLKKKINSLCEGNMIM